MNTDPSAGLSINLASGRRGRWIIDTTSPVFEHTVRVPGNRIGGATFSLPQVNLSQEIISFIFFVRFVRGS